MAEMPPARASDRVTVTQFLGAGPPGELRWKFGLFGLGAHGRPARSEVLTCPSGSLPRSVVRHVGMEVALWEGGRGAPTVAALAVEAGLDERTVEVALEILAEVTGYPLRRRASSRRAGSVMAWHLVRVERDLRERLRAAAREDLGPAASEAEVEAVDDE